MEKNNQRENHILDTILRQLIKSDDVFNPVDDLLKQCGVYATEDELNCCLSKLKKSNFIDEKYETTPDGQKRPCDPRRHKITKKGGDFIKTNSFSKLGTEKEKRRKKEDHLLNLRLFRNWVWIIISVPSVLFTLNTVIKQMFHINLLKGLFTFLRSLISQ